MKRIKFNGYLADNVIFKNISDGAVMRFSTTITVVPDKYFNEKEAKEALELFSKRHLTFIIEER